MICDEVVLPGDLQRHPRLSPRPARAVQNGNQMSQLIQPDSGTANLIFSVGRRRDGSTGLSTTHRSSA
jgi:hypothetical protein